MNLMSRWFIRVALQMFGRRSLPFLWFLVLVSVLGFYRAMEVNMPHTQLLHLAMLSSLWFLKQSFHSCCQYFSLWFLILHWWRWGFFLAGHEILGVCLTRWESLGGTVLRDG